MKIIEDNQRDPNKFKFQYLTAGFVVAMHLLVFYAINHISAIAIASFVFMYIATLLFGITFGYHRMLAHRSFVAHPLVELASLSLGALALQGGPISWVIAHRRHHMYSDHDGDPHSPINGFLWSHFGWLFWTRLSDCESPKWDRNLKWSISASAIERLFIPLNILVPILVFLIVNFLSGTSIALSIFLWAFPCRIVAVWHATWLINSATHLWGYKTYDTGDRSLNNGLVATLTFGEGWHNNHHHNPGLACHGHAWFEIDLTYLTICAFARLGLVRNVRSQIKQEDM